MDSCGEYFFFYGLKDFILFLVLAWRHGSLVSEIFFVFFYPEYLALVPSATNPVQQLIFSFLFSRWREEGATSVFYLLSGTPRDNIKYMISKHILSITFLNKPELIILLTVKWFHLISNNSV